MLQGGYSPQKILDHWFCRAFQFLSAISLSSRAPSITSIRIIEFSLEVSLDILRISKQGIKGEFACVVELVARCLSQETINHGESFHFLPGIKHSLMGREETVMKTLHNCHRKNDQTILMRFERAAHHICHVPDYRCLSAIFVPTMVNLSFAIVAFLLIWNNLYDVIEATI